MILKTGRAALPVADKVLTCKSVQRVIHGESTDSCKAFKSQWRSLFTQPVFPLHRDQVQQLINDHKLKRIALHLRDHYACQLNSTIHGVEIMYQQPRSIESTNKMLTSFV